MGASLSTLLSEAHGIIGYDAMEDEPDFRPYFRLHGISTPVDAIPPSKDIPPADVADSFSGTFKGKRVVILVPGRRFDATGTRHGRGHGWYDRFLAAVPREWLRVGVLSTSEFSKTKLTRQSWDQPMDMLLISGANGWEVIEAET